MLIRLKYASTLAPTTTTDEIDAIVSHSAVWNHKRGITGVLSVDDRSILQVLEGPSSKVDGLFDVISEDSRHQGVVLLDRAEIAEPHFAQWGMVRRSLSGMLLLMATLD